MIYAFKRKTVKRELRKMWKTKRAEKWKKEIAEKWKKEIVEKWERLQKDRAQREEPSDGGGLQNPQRDTVSPV
jgi:hypothetical protein